MDIIDVVSTWLHLLAMTIVIGYYGILGRFVLPALRKSIAGPDLARSITAIERRAMPFIVLCIILFTITGFQIMVDDGRYAGLGEMFASRWTTMLTVKHLLILVMIALGVLYNRLAVGLAEVETDEARAREVGYLGLAAEGLTVLGAIVLLLTAVAQAS
jgi:hypothetical protein